MLDVVAWRRKRRVLARVSRAAWRLEQAERERAWALGGAKAEGASIREIAAAAGLSSSRVHQVVTGADIDRLDAALGVLRSAGWPALEDPDVDDGELAAGVDVAGRLDDEVEWIRQCADWLEYLDRGPYLTVVNLRPESDWPRRFGVAADLPRVVAVLRRVAYDVGELARSRRVDDLDQGAVGEDPRAERRRRTAEPALDFIAFCRRRKIPHQSTPQLERAYDAWNAERYERGETDQGSWQAYNPVREARNRPGNWTL